MTPLDQAHMAMAQNAEDDAARLRFYQTLAGQELVLMLSAEPQGDQVSPHVFPVADQSYVLVFDSEERLVRFTEAETQSVAMPGRDVVEMLAGQGLGLGVNLGVAASEILIPADGVEWLWQMLANQTELAPDTPERFCAPVGLEAELQHGLGEKMAQIAGLADHAFGAGVVYQNGQHSNVLVFVNALEAAEAALRQMVSDVVSFSAKAVSLDILFVRSTDPVCAQLDEVGIRFAIPRPEVTAKVQAPEAPGMDPGRPPVLR